MHLKITYLFIIFLSIGITSGCSSSKISKDRSLNQESLSVKDSYSLYGKITRSGDTWKFKDVCYKHKFFSFHEKYKSKLNVEFEKNLSIKSLRKCGVIGANNGRAASVGYINLSDLKPMISTRSFKCNGSLYGGTTCGMDLPEFWESDFRESSLLLWLAIFPAIVGNYWTDIRFDREEYREAVFAALDNKKEFDLKSKHKEFISEYSEQKKKFYGNLNRYIAAYEAEEKQALEAKQKERLARMKFQERQNNLAREKQRQIRASFNSGIYAKEIGDEVCTKYNRFGYLERIAGNKIQIRLKGIADSTEEYLLFSGSRFNYNKKDEMVWDQSRKWAKCDIAGL